MKKHLYPISLMSLAFLYPALLVVGLTMERPVGAQQSAAGVSLDAFAYEELAVTDAGVVPLTKATYSPDGQPSAKLAVLTVETGAIRYKAHGVNPSGTSGHLVAAATEYPVWGINNILRFRMIADTATAATVTVTYYR